MKYFVTVLILAVALAAMAQHPERPSDIEKYEIDPENHQESLEGSNRNKRGFFDGGYGYSAPYFYRGYKSYYRRPYSYYRNYRPYSYYGYNENYDYY